jgi:hypothetical protein
MELLVVAVGLGMMTVAAALIAAAFALRWMADVAARCQSRASFTSHSTPS